MPQLIPLLALVSETTSVNISEVTIVAAAIQKQISRDLSPCWNVQGTIGAFEKMEDIPPGYWPIIVRDDIEQDAAGAHCDQNGQPIALVTAMTAGR